jgi:diadenosine tetraphosphate (Ap4A) HIT family hydrolase
LGRDTYMDQQEFPESSLPVETAIHRRVSEARAGRDNSVLGRCASGWAVFGQQQFVEGYLLLLPDPVVPDLNALTPERRSQFLLDMSRLGDALVRTTAPLRINYAIFGNLEPALHAHVIPRYRNEPENMRTQHPWMYDWNKAPAFDPIAAAPLMRALRTELAHLGALRTP